MAENVTPFKHSDPTEEKPPPPELGIEWGVSSPFPGNLWTDWAPEEGSSLVNSKAIVTIDQIVDMRRRDGQARALVQLITLPLLLSLQTGEWIEPEGGKATKEVEFANMMWTTPSYGGGMTVPSTKLIRQIMLFLVDGFSSFEIVRQIPKFGPLKGKITLRKLAYRDPRTITFKVDDNGGYNGFRQVAQTPDGRVRDVWIRPRKSVTFTHQDEQNPYYGVSILESAYPHFDAKRKLYYIAHLAAQFAAIAARVGEVPHGARLTEIAAFRKALANLAFNGSMVAPPGYKVTPFNGHTGFDFLKLIEHHNVQMSKSILASFFDADQRPVLIANGDSEASIDLFLLCLESIANDIADTLTRHVMPQFIDFNFHSRVYPVFRPGQMSDTAREAIRNMFQTVVTAGILNSTPEFVREMEKKVTDQFGLDIDYDEIAKREKEAAEQRAAAEQENADIQGAGGPQSPPGGDQPGPPSGPPSGPPEGSGGPPAPSEAPSEVQASASAIDELVQAAQALFTTAPPDDHLEPVDAGV